MWERAVNGCETIADVLPFWLFLTWEASPMVEAFANLSAGLGRCIIDFP